jgi:ankyrin repeat protein
MPVEVVGIALPGTGDTPLHVSVRCCDLFKSLCNDADAFAFETSQLAFVMYLINAGADVNATNSDGDTAEFLAKRSGHKRMESLLFIAGVVSRRY